MIKRAKATKVGDIFEVKVSDIGKKYMQYIANDLSQLNSDVVRGFSKIYNIETKPSLQEIVSDKVDFYAHCDSRHGIRLGLWSLYGNIQDVGDLRKIIFRDTNDTGDVISSRWYVWYINEDFIRVDNMDPRLKNSFYGVVYPAKMISFRMKNGYFYGVTPRFE